MHEIVSITTFQCFIARNCAIVIIDHIYRYLRSDNKKKAKKTIGHRATRLYIQLSYLL